MWRVNNYRLAPVVAGKWPGPASGFRAARAVSCETNGLPSCGRDRRWRVPGARTCARGCPGAPRAGWKRRSRGEAGDGWSGPGDADHRPEPFGGISSTTRCGVGGDGRDARSDHAACPCPPANEPPVQGKGSFAGGQGHGSFSLKQYPTGGRRLQTNAWKVKCHWHGLRSAFYSKLFQKHDLMGRRRSSLTLAKRLEIHDALSNCPAKNPIAQQCDSDSFGGIRTSRPWRAYTLSFLRVVSLRSVSMI